MILNAVIVFILRFSPNSTDFPADYYYYYYYYMIYIAPISRIESEALASLGGEHD